MRDLKNRNKEKAAPIFALGREVTARLKGTISQENKQNKMCSVMCVNTYLTNNRLCLFPIFRHFITFFSVPGGPDLTAAL